LAALPSQSAKPARQVKPQALPAQYVVAFAGATQARPQAPQCAASVARFTQAPAQNVVGAMHTETHPPTEHTVPAVHARMHAPQWALLARRSTSQPLAAAPSQSP
jgi:hypothetical protein